MSIFNLKERILNEIRIITNKSIEDTSTLKDTDVIRVYHGFDNYQDAIIALKFGLSGNERVGRNYSYESNNNPKGLFVTPDFDTAKYFTHPRGEEGISIILELHVKVADLEAPVWPNGRFTIQGELSQYWDDESDRYKRGTLKARETAKNSKYEFINQSDRPEVAFSLVIGEPQALFVGDLNPNMIKNVWFGKSGDYGKRIKSFKRISRNDFLKRFKEYKFKKDYNGNRSTKEQEFDTKADKVFKPNDDFSMDNVERYLKKHDMYDDLYVDASSFMKDIMRYELIHQYFWPKQIKQIKDLMLKESIREIVKTELKKLY